MEASELQGDPHGLSHGLLWIIFWVSFLVLAVFDIVCLAPRSGLQDGNSNGEIGGQDPVVPAISLRTAVLHSLFWFGVGLLFNVVIFFLQGWDMALIWFDGYILEYLLSMDNLFFFHVVFTAYATPPSQTYKGLFLGILGAVVLRLVFYFVGAQFFRIAYVVQIGFGLILVYSGYKTAATDEDDEDPRSNRCVICLTKTLPLTDTYEDNGALFTWVNEFVSTDPPTVAPGVIGKTHGFEVETGGNAVGVTRRRLRGTMLLLVVVVLQVVDLIFAVDSVTAKIAEYDSIFINFSSSAFSMLCLRSMYFVLIRMMGYFRFLKYGVAVVLIFIGIKLMVVHWFEIPSLYSLLAICGLFFLSMMLSILFPELEEEGELDGDTPTKGSSPKVSLDFADAEACEEAEMERLADHRVDAGDCDDSPGPEMY